MSGTSLAKCRLIWVRTICKKPVYCLKINKSSTHVDVRAKKAGVFSYELCYCKYTDQTNQTQIPILIEPLLGTLIAQSKKDQESIQSRPHLTQDITWESDKNTIRHHIQESQDISPFPAGDHKAAMNIQENMINTKHK